MIILNEHIIDEQKLPEKPVIIDAGACFGEFTKEIRRIRPNAFIIGLEPNKSHYKNLINSNLYNILYNKALVGNKKITTIDFYEFEGLPRWGNISKLNIDTTHPKLKQIKKYKVECITLKQIIKLNNFNNIDYLKMDIEGSEKEVIEYLKIKITKKIKQIGFEIHYIFNPALLENTFKKLGYSNCTIQGNEVLVK